MDTTTLSQPATTLPIAAQIKRYEGTAARILEMLGNGLSPTVVSSALGVSESYISQLLSEEQFSVQVTGLRYANLQAATSRDRNYDAMEDTLIDKMRELIPLMYKPMEVLRAITVINAAKRRGADAPDNTVIHQTIVQLTLPQVVASKFVTNVNNQVIEAGNQELITIAANHLTSKLATIKSEQLLSGGNNDSTHNTATASASGSAG
jgi:hypothetical protein